MTAQTALGDILNSVPYVIPSHVSVVKLREAFSFIYKSSHDQTSNNQYTWLGLISLLVVTDVRSRRSFSNCFDSNQILYLLEIG